MEGKALKEREQTSNPLQCHLSSMEVLWPKPVHQPMDIHGPQQCTSWLHGMQSTWEYFLWKAQAFSHRERNADKGWPLPYQANDLVLKQLASKSFWARWL